MVDLTCPCRVTAAEKIPYSACCAPYVDDGKPARSPEILMRSRYCAYATHKIDYLYESLAPEARHDFDRKAVEHWSGQARWLGLEIIGVEGGQPGDERGYVEFIAHFELEGQRHDHRERSLFRFDAERDGWLFVEEANRKPAPVVKGAQVGRNDPCPCGSGKKFKKCCGLAAA